MNQSEIRIGDEKLSLKLYIWLKKFHVSRCFPIVTSCITYTKLFPLGSCCNTWGLARVGPLAFPEMFYLILKFQTSLELNNWTAAKITFFPSSMLEKIFISKKCLPTTDIHNQLNIDSSRIVLSNYFHACRVMVFI